MNFFDFKLFSRQEIYSLNFDCTAPKRTVKEMECNRLNRSFGLKRLQEFARDNVISQWSAMYGYGTIGPRDMRVDLNEAIGSMTEKKRTKEIVFDTLDSSSYDRRVQWVSRSGPRITRGLGFSITCVGNVTISE